VSNRLKGKKVLIVDDEPDVLETLEDLLSDCKTETSTSFADAKVKLDSGAYDIAVLDIMGVDGYQLLKIAASRKIVAVMLTAYALSPEDVAKSFNDGASFYLPKEEMVHIKSYLNDILEDIDRGRTPWERWLEKLGDYAERHFGPDWQKDDKNFWEKFPFY